MDRKEAKALLQDLVGQDLRELADSLGVTVFKPYLPPGKKPTARHRFNKGWAGQTVQRYLELAGHSNERSQWPWTVRVVPLREAKDGSLRVKETVAIAPVKPRTVRHTSFFRNRVFSRLQRVLLVARSFEGPHEPRSIVLAVTQFRLDDGADLDLTSSDYTRIASRLKNRGLRGLRGTIGEKVQARTKGRAGTTRRAFYARRAFVAEMLGL